MDVEPSWSPLGSHRAHRIKIEDWRSHGTAAPIRSIKFGGLEVLDKVQPQFMCEALYVAYTGDPRCTHVCKALNKFRDSRIAGCLGNHSLGHVVKGQPESLQVFLDLREDVLRALQRQVHGVSFPNQKRGQIKI